MEEVNVVTPDIHLRTSYVLDKRGRIKSTREPEPTPGPLFTLIRSALNCAWAVRADVPEELAAELDRLAGGEPQMDAEVSRDGGRRKPELFEEGDEQ